MKVKDKANELAKDYAPAIENLDAKIVLYDAIMEMAEWKEQEMLNKITTRLKYNANRFAYISAHNHEAKVNENYLVEELLKEMKEE